MPVGLNLLLARGDDARSRAHRDPGTSAKRAECARALLGVRGTRAPSSAVAPRPSVVALRGTLNDRSRMQCVHGHALTACSLLTLGRANRAGDGSATRREGVAHEASGAGCCRWSEGKYGVGVASPIRIHSLRFNSGQVIDVSETDVVVLVGANNTGKSRTLSEVLAILSRQPRGVATDLYALSDVAMTRLADLDGLMGWFEVNRDVYQVSGQAYRSVRTFNEGEVSEPVVRSHFLDDRLGNIAPYLVRSLMCSERLGYLGSPPRLDYGQNANHPIQAVAGNAVAAERLAQAISAAFGLNLLYDNWGNSLKLRVHASLSQDALSYTSADGSLPPEKRDEFSRIPLLDSQSDGVRAFAGIMLMLLTSDYPVYLLDEPEAFLHPPQAREMGRRIANMPGEQQVFVATHSLDVLLGMLEGAGTRRLKILRLFREEGITSVAELDQDNLEAIRTDPLLTFTRALDGIFHDLAVVCEGDSDAAFYSLYARESSVMHPMFIQAGAKHRVHKIAGALRAVGVPIRVILDFDSLNDEQIIKRVVQSVGGEWDEVTRRNWRILDAELRSGRLAPTHGDVRLFLTSSGKGDGEEFTRADREALDLVVTPSSGWTAAKSMGLAAVPQGDGYRAAVELLDKLSALGVHVVPTGQMESFIKAVGGHGPSWVVKVVEDSLWQACEEAKSFVGRVLSLAAGAEAPPADAANG